MKSREIGVRLLKRLQQSHSLLILTGLDQRYGIRRARTGIGSDSFLDRPQGLYRTLVILHREVAEPQGGSNPFIIRIALERVPERQDGILIVASVESRHPQIAVQRFQGRIPLSGFTEIGHRSVKVVMRARRHSEIIVGVGQCRLELIEVSI